MVAILLATGVCSTLPAAGDDWGMTPVNETLPWFDARKAYRADFAPAGGEPPLVTAVTSLKPAPITAPLRLLLSREVAPAEDGHLDAILWLDAPEGARPEGSLSLSVKDAAGKVLASQEVSPIPARKLFFSPRFGSALAGKAGRVEVAWRRDKAAPAVAAADFSVAPPAGAPASGRVRLWIPNTTAATIQGAPMTVGAPFPRGSLWNEANVRLVDERGAEIPLQTRVTARWSRFGSVKWLLCDFTLDLAGQAREVFVEFGPAVKRQSAADMAVATDGGGAPRLDAGRLRLDGGVSFDPDGAGRFRKVAGADALCGAFVEDVNGANYKGWGHKEQVASGRVFEAGRDGAWQVEEKGSNKVVLRRNGWFKQADGNGRFCQYDVRLVVHRGSPVARLFFTWVYTGDSDADRVRNLGWRFALEGAKPEGFLSSFDDGKWLKGGFVVQHDHDKFDLMEEAGRFPKKTGDGRRAPGVMAASGDGFRVFLGVKDFWQNFPAEMAFEKDAMVFYQWPRHGKPRSHTPDLGTAYRLWFAHEGEVMDLRLPREIAEGPIYVTESGPEPHFAYGRPETVNAQGVAKTAEMWLLFTDDKTSADAAVKTLKGLNDETLRPVVDPSWLTGTGVFFEIGPADPKARPEDERVYGLHAAKVAQYIDRMAVYGKWIYGDVLRAADMEQQTGSLYRTFRRSHWGWPFSWTPFARTGDTRFLKQAEAATRILTDVGFCHYVSDDMAARFAAFPPRYMWDFKQPFRARGFWNRNLIPWNGYWGPTARCYVDKVDHVWHAYYMTGYARGRDVAMVWAEETKRELPDFFGRGPLLASSNRARWPVNLQRQYLFMYEATFDPWFLAAAHAIADMHIDRFKTENWPGHPWQTGPQDFQRFTGRKDHLEFFLSFARRQADWHETGWADSASTLMASAAYGYLLTKDDLYLRRVAGLVDFVRWGTYDGEPEWFKGFLPLGVGDPDMLYTGWALQWHPLALEALNRAGKTVEPEPLAFDQGMDGVTVAMKKAAGRALVLRPGKDYRLLAPDGSEAAWAGKQGQGVAQAWTGRIRELGKRGGAEELEVAADAPAGVYRLKAAGALRVPVSAPGTPEVMELAPGKPMPMGKHWAQYWFLAPAQAGEIAIEFDNPVLYRQFVRDMRVWSPGGAVAWRHTRFSRGEAGPAKIQAAIKVNQEDAGKLWRVTLPGVQSVPFRVGAGVAPVFSLSRERWFDPGEVAGK